MASVGTSIALCVVACLASATPLPQGGTNFTMQQLFNTMSQVMVENMNLEMNLKSLKDENSRLTSTLSQTESQRANLEVESTTCKRQLNASIEDQSICSSVKTECDAKNSDLTKDLGRCEAVKTSLETDKLIHHHVLNASKVAHDECKADLLQLKDVKVKLEMCKTGVVAKFPPNCKAWREAGYTKTDNYWIDPDGPGGVERFQVECVMDSYHGEPIIVMHHNSEARMDAGPNKREPSYSNVRNVVYQASIQQMTEVIKRSAKCEQFIKYECLHNPITNYATWYSRDGTPMYYWGGAAPGSGKCACGMTNSCDVPGKVCNCDQEDSVWRYDSGLLTDKNTLPVTKMAFGDLFSSIEAGYHRLGALRCYG